MAKLNERNIKLVSGVALILFFGIISLLLIFSDTKVEESNIIHKGHVLANPNGDPIPISRSEDPIKEIINSGYSGQRVQRLYEEDAISLVPSGTSCRPRIYTFDNSFAQTEILEGKFKGQRVWTFMSLIKKSQ